MLTAGGDGPLSSLKAGKTKAFLNMEANMSGDFIHDPNLRYPTGPLQKRFERVLDHGDIDYIDATQLALALTGDAIGSNLFLVGYAWQKGALPVSDKAIKKAIRINGVKPDWNIQAFEWGRLAAHDPDRRLKRYWTASPKPKNQMIS